MKEDNVVICPICQNKLLSHKMQTCIDEQYIWSCLDDVTNSSSSHYFLVVKEGIIYTESMKIDSYQISIYHDLNESMIITGKSAPIILPLILKSNKLSSDKIKNYILFS